MEPQYPEWIAMKGGRLLHSAWLDYSLRNGNRGRTSTWYQSDAERKDLELMLKGQPRPKTFEMPVVLIVTRVLGPRECLWDPDSILRGNTKELIDSLVAAKWFHDDSPKWIKHVIGLQDDRKNERKKRRGPAIIVQVWDVEFELVES